MAEETDELITAKRQNKEILKGQGPLVPFKGSPTVTYLPPIISHLPNIPP
jgi:hypothetical protein